MTQLEINTLGGKLKKRRNEMNLTLKEVESATSIRLNYLQAIEDNKVQHLISPVYAQGFMRQYAVFLGMDPEKITREHPEIFQKSAAQEFSYGIGTLEMRNTQGSSGRGVSNLVWGGLLVFVLIAAWYLASLFEVI